MSLDATEIDVFLQHVFPVRCYNKFPIGMYVSVGWTLG